MFSNSNAIPLHESVSDFLASLTIPTLKYSFDP